MSRSALGIIADCLEVGDSAGQILEELHRCHYHIVSEPMMERADMPVTSAAHAFYQDLASPVHRTTITGTVDGREVRSSGSLHPANAARAADDPRLRAHLDADIADDWLNLLGGELKVPGLRERET